jgi:hypothetical protein
VPLGGADLLFDEVEVVEEPFPGRRDARSGRDGRLQQLAGGHQRAFVLRQAREQPVPAATRPASRVQLVPACQRLAVALHLVGAVELRAQRRLGSG